MHNSETRLKTSALYNFKRVNCTLCELHLHKAVLKRETKESEREQLMHPRVKLEPGLRRRAAMKDILGTTGEHKHGLYTYVLDDLLSSCFRKVC